MNTPDETILTEFARREIQTRLDQAARAISARLFPDSWAGWIIYLLEALQDRASDDAYRNMLLNVMSDIETRLLEETW